MLPRESLEIQQTGEGACIARLSIAARHAWSMLGLGGIVALAGVAFIVESLFAFGFAPSTILVSIFASIPAAFAVWGFRALFAPRYVTINPTEMAIESNLIIGGRKTKGRPLALNEIAEVRADSFTSLTGATKYSLEIKRQNERSWRRLCANLNYSGILGLAALIAESAGVEALDHRGEALSFRTWPFLSSKDSRDPISLEELKPAKGHFILPPEFNGRRTLKAGLPLGNGVIAILAGLSFMGAGVGSFLDSYHAAGFVPFLPALFFGVGALVFAAAGLLVAWREFVIIEEKCVLQVRRYFFSKSLRVRKVIPREAILEIDVREGQRGNSKRRAVQVYLNCPAHGDVRLGWYSGVKGLKGKFLEELSACLEVPVRGAWEG